jgi:hypothetical protein
VPEKKAVSMVLEEMSSTTNRPFVSDNLSATQIYYDIVKSPNDTILMLGDSTSKVYSKVNGLGSKMSQILQGPIEDNTPPHPKIKLSPNHKRMPLEKAF